MKLTCSVITTFRCNANCHMCNIWKFPTRTEEEFSLQTINKLPKNLYRINVTGGEPMLREDIDEIIEVLYRKTKILEISTNGYFTDKIKKIVERHPDIMIRISLEGLPSYNDRLRGTKDGFDHALRTILELKRLKAKNIGFSMVICDKNASEIKYLYELCSYLGIEFGNATMHNSWYFHKYDNKIDDRDEIVNAEKEYIQSLLKSNRYGMKGKVKDWLRAYFNRSILKMVEGRTGFRPPCVAGTDMFFLDPYGNIIPCNGTDEKWIMGNLKDDNFENIWNGEKARTIRKMVLSCQKTCCFVSTERYDMIRKPWVPLAWIVSNKTRQYFNKPIRY
jgi:Fe-coproporphyrin III synthase